MSTATQDKIVESIYDSALNPQNWQETVVLINDAFNSTASGFFIQTIDHEAVDFFFHGLDSTELQFYAEHLADKNPWFTVPGLMRPGRILSDHSLEVLYNDKSAFTRTEMYQDWYRRLGLRHSMGGNLLDYNGNLLNFTFMRPASCGYYSEEEINRFKLLSGHLTRAMEINDKIISAEQPGIFINETVLNQLRIGIVLLDGSSKVCFINHYAKKLLDRDKTLSIHSSRLQSPHKKNQEQINKALKTAYKSRFPSTLSIYRTKGTPLAVSVIPSKDYRNFLGMTCLQVAIMIVDPDDRDIGTYEYFAQRWHLTPLESRFCMLMIENMTITQIAGELHLTQNTARWYLKQIMHKLDVNRQTELILKLLNDLPTHCVLPNSIISQS